MLTYYSSIIPNSFRCLLFSKLCQHNWSRPSCRDCNCTRQSRVQLLVPTTCL